MSPLPTPEASSSWKAKLNVRAKRPDIDLDALKCVFSNNNSITLSDGCYSEETRKKEEERDRIDLARCM
jgi:hypothetical protein